MKKILIVEDDQLLANVYRNKFSVEGFSVEVANDAPAGLDMAQTFLPDAIILDLMLPQMTGVEFMKTIRARDGFQKLPVIVFSNTYLTNMVQEAWKAGATKCLSKASCTPKQLIDVLKTTLNLNGSTAKQGHHQARAIQARQPAAEATHNISPASGLRADPKADLALSQNLPATLNALRAQLQPLIKADNDLARVHHARELYKRVHALTGSAAIAGLPRVAHVADALEALLKELFENPKSINSSVLRTAASAIDFIGVLYERGLSGDADVSNANILVVDDEAISRRAISHSLEKARLKCQAVENSAAAMELLSRKVFDLIFLDIDMPGMNGFELCARLRALPAYKKTPVVFVTKLNDFDNRANSTISGGNDFIAKPFLFMELAVKAVVHLMRPHIGK